MSPFDPFVAGRFPHKISGIKQRVRGSKFQEHYNQAQLFYNSLTPYEKAHMVAAFSFELSHCDDPIVYENYTKLLNMVDFDLAKQVATNVGGIVPEEPMRANKGQKSRLSQLEFAPEAPTVAGRRIAILVADGFNLAEVQAIRGLIKSSMATSYVIGPRRGKIYAAGEKVGVGAHLWADHHFEGQRSTLFDALLIPSGAHVQKLAENGRTVHWVREAFGHCKTIGAIGEGKTASIRVKSPLAKYLCRYFVLAGCGRSAQGGTCSVAHERCCDHLVRGGYRRQV